MVITKQQKNTGNGALANKYKIIVNNTQFGESSMTQSNGWNGALLHVDLSSKKTELDPFALGSPLAK